MTKTKINANILNIIKDIWKFLVHDNSLLSYIADLLLMFIFIKFILFPLCGVVLNTTHPFVAVVSESMEHRVTKINYNNEEKYAICSKILNDKIKIDFEKYWNLCGRWYEKHNITKQRFLSFPFHNGFNRGDVMIIKGVKPESIKVGDVIVFMYFYNYNGKFYKMPIIHRVVKREIINGTVYFTTKGDHNPDIGMFDTNIIGSYTKHYDKTKKVLVGKAIARIPYLGIFKCWLNRLFGLGALK